jgi:hypothetical protein
MYGLRTNVMFVITFMCVVCLTRLGAAIDYVEAEPNSTRAQANVIGAGGSSGSGMVAGDRIVGTTTGNAPGNAGGSADYFTISVAYRPAGIYKYTLTFTSSTPGHVITLRGLQLSGGWPVLDSDITVLNALPSATIPGGRYVQWYGFGNATRVTVRIDGKATTTAPYIATLTEELITPNNLGETFDGVYTLREGELTSPGVDSELMMYDVLRSTPIAALRHDEPDSAGLTAPLPPGIYYIMIAPANIIDSLGSRPEEVRPADRTLPVSGGLAVVGTSTVGASQLQLAVTGGDFAASATYTSVGPMDVQWSRLRVLARPLATPPRCTPNYSQGIAHFQGEAQRIPLNITVAPGTNPQTSYHEVAIDLSALGGPSAQPLTLAETEHWEYELMLVPNLPVGEFTLPITVREVGGLSRSSMCTLTLRVSPERMGRCYVVNVCTPGTISQCNIISGEWLPGVCGVDDRPNVYNLENFSCNAAMDLAPGDLAQASVSNGDPPGHPCNVTSTSTGAPWYRFVGTGSILMFEACSTDGAPLRGTPSISILCGDCGSLSCVASGSIGCASESGGTQFSVCTTLGTEYYAVVTGGTGHFALSLTDTASVCESLAVCPPRGACCTPYTCQNFTELRCREVEGYYGLDGTRCALTRDEQRFATAYREDINITVHPGQTVQRAVLAGQECQTVTQVLELGLNIPDLSNVMLALQRGERRIPVLINEPSRASAVGAYRFYAGPRIGAIERAGVAVPGEYGYNSEWAIRGEWTLEVTNTGTEALHIESIARLCSGVNTGCQRCWWCPADFDDSGNVSTLDVMHFFEAWSISDQCADINRDGGIDGADAQSFLDGWMLGMCER